MIARRFGAFAVMALSFASTPGATAAMEIESRYYDTQSLVPPALTVTLRGQIVRGDSQKLRDELAKHDEKSFRDLIFEFDSPGGSMIEGIRVGEIIAARPEMTTSSIAGSDRPICASACVYAYLGSNYRYIHREAKLGVHKFYSTAEMSSSEAMARGQDLSALIMSWLRSRGVKPEFFSDIVSAPGDDIAWVPHERLAELSVVSQGVRAQTVEYKNLDGMIYLRCYS